MTTLVAAISSALIHFLWQGSIVGILLWLVLFALRNKSANARYWVSCAALALMALLPLSTALAMYTGAGGHRPPLQQSSATSGILVTAQSAGVQVSPSRLQTWALTLWSFGVLVFSFRLFVGYSHAFQLRRRGKPAGESVVMVIERLSRVMAIRRQVQVLMSAMSDSPSVVGWFRPVILLPAATLMGLTPLQLEAVLAHELAHIKRYDYLINMMQMVVETLLFYHPAVWWTSKRIRAERELCCDDLAVRFSGNALRYARALTTLEKLRLTAPTVAMASTGGPLLFRIQRLVGVSTKEYGFSRLPALLAMSLGILCFVLNATWIHGQDAPGVSVDLGTSSVIHRAPVRYPEAAKKQGITGTVQVEVTLDSAGDVSDARVLTGPAELRKTALESVLSWHFTSDAARATRLITISFTDKGTQVQVGQAQERIASTQEFLQQRQKELENRQIEIEKAQVVVEQRAAAELKRAELDTLKRQALAAQQDAAQAELMKAEVELRNLQDGNDGLTEQRKAELEAAQVKLKVLKAQLQAEAFKQSGGGDRGNPINGRTLKSISAPGLSESVRNDLTSRLPVRVGDILSNKLLELTAGAVRSYDEHLTIRFLATDDGQAELRISTPGERR